MIDYDWLYTLWYSLWYSLDEMQDWFVVYLFSKNEENTNQLRSWFW